MADTAIEERLTSLEVRLAKLEGTVEARERDLPSRYDRMEDLLERLDEKVDRSPWFVLGSWITIMAALFGGFYLDRTSELVPSRADHGASKLVEPRLSGPVTPKTDYPLKAHRVGTVLLAGQLPRSEKPKTQRFWAPSKMVPAVTETC
jgi:uncharacterized coiled-coil protein SlyX